MWECCEEGGYRILYSEVEGELWSCGYYKGIWVLFVVCGEIEVW